MFSSASGNHSATLTPFGLQLAHDAGHEPLLQVDDDLAFAIERAADDAPLRALVETRAARS